MKILFAPFARALRNGYVNAKNYPYAKELGQLLSQLGHAVVQVRALGEAQVTDTFISGKDFNELSDIILGFDTFIGVDSYLQHHCWFLNKKGIVIWSISDPAIYGHELHINLLKDKKTVRPDQFNTYEGVAVNPEAFPLPVEVLRALQEL